MTTAKHPHNKGLTFPADYLTEQEAQAIFNACPDTPIGIRNRALLVLMYRSGLRVGEALKLKTGSIDLEAHRIRLHQTKSRIAQVRGFNPAADNDLKRWIQRREELGLGPGFLFCTVRPPAGGSLQERQIRELTANLGKKARVDKRVHPHIFRHSFTVALERRGVGINTIAKLLGHKTPWHTVAYLERLTNNEAITLLENVDMSSSGGGKMAQVSEPEDLEDDYEEW